MKMSQKCQPSTWWVLRSGLLVSLKLRTQDLIAVSHAAKVFKKVGPSLENMDIEKSFEIPNKECRVDPETLPQLRPWDAL